jgi:hypothetical protein
MGGVLFYGRVSLGGEVRKGDGEGHMFSFGSLLWEGSVMERALMGSPLGAL